MEARDGVLVDVGSADGRKAPGASKLVFLPGGSFEVARPLKGSANPLEPPEMREGTRIRDALLCGRLLNLLQRRITIMSEHIYANSTIVVYQFQHEVFLLTSMHARIFPLGSKANPQGTRNPRSIRDHPRLRLTGLLALLPLLSARTTLCFGAAMNSGRSTI